MCAGERNRDVFTKGVTERLPGTGLIPLRTGQGRAGGLRRAIMEHISRFDILPDAWRLPAAPQRAESMDKGRMKGT